MKRVLCVLLLLMPLCLLTVSAAEEETQTEDFYQGQLEASGAKGLMEELPEETVALLKELGIEELDYRDFLSFDPKRLVSLLGQVISGQIENPLKAGAAALGIMLLCALLEGMKTAGDNKTLGGVFSLVAVLSVGGVIILPVLRCLADVGAAIKLSGGFMLSFVPILAALIAASGSPLSAYAYNTLVFTAAQLISRFASTVLSPLVGIYMGIHIASGISPHVDLSEAGSAIKKGVTGVLTFVSTLFVGLLSVQSIVASAADTVTLKAAKFLTSSLVPVVGGVLSDTVATMQGCIGLVKGTVGAFGLIVLALIYLPVLAEAACWSLIIGMCTVASDTLGLKDMTRLLKGVGSALSILIAILVFCGALLLVSTAIMIKVKAG